MGDLNRTCNDDDVEIMRRKIGKMADGATLANLIKEAIRLSLEENGVAKIDNNCDKICNKKGKQ